ncbi:DUF4123 domain-containing protein [Pseudomonas alliivorans]|nr:DUF4123 domain-containing protein [Pseudomonas alliivorans]MEE4689501.1 DUF4123 domain-containing protein [Pseudomonas alliivorans]MEE4699035.1 DUF4123 domain-containing protein [Pseudomonas alliivorans]MEE4709854.1 DUF4123 domain-containing protein [Pseudomonas alliivorans]MEE4725888.1 DUF4123 domain-containing protein [Pseudomonas alliivorans]
MPEFETGPHDLPWSKNAYLLLNPINVPDLTRRMAEWELSGVRTMLFLQTRLRERLDASPALIQLEGPDDPMFVRFLAHAHEEWGLLLFSPADRKTLIDHLRWLMFVEMPTGQTCYMNLSDTSLANALFGMHPAHFDNRLFGPIDHVYAPDRMTEQWGCHPRIGESAPHDPGVPYRLSAEQIEAFGDVMFRLTVVNLDQHLRLFFPDYLPGVSLKTRYEQVHRLASTAYEQGFKSEADIFHYANVVLFLADQPEDSHPPIRALLRDTSELPPSQRIEQAHWLVVLHARQQEGASQ